MKMLINAKKLIAVAVGLIAFNGICNYSGMSYGSTDNMANESANFYRLIDYRSYLIKGKSPISDGLATKINCYHFIYDKNNRPIIIEHLRNGKISNDLPASLVAKIVVEYPAEDVQKRTYQGIGGKPVVNEQGVFSTKLKIDYKTKQVQSFTYDSSGQLAEDQFGIAEKLSLLDDTGRVTKSIGLFDKAHNKIVNKDGVPYQYWFKYNPNGDVIEVSTHSDDGRLVEGRNGTVVSASKYDEHGNLTETSFYGINNDLTEGNEYGTATMRFKYDDKGNRIEDSYFGAYGQAEKNKYNVALTQYTYDESGALIETKNYGINNELVESSKDGVTVHRWKYDSKGNIVEVSDWGIDGKLKENNDGWAIYRIQYDSNGNMAEQSTFGADTNLIENKTGWAIFRAKYDAKGNGVEQSTFGVDGKLKDGKNGWAIIKVTLDAQGNVIEKATYGADGMLREERDGIAVRKFKYDDKKNVIEEDDYGVINSQPKAKHRFLYDDKGRKIKESMYDADEHLKEDAHGVATYRFKYNEADGTIEVSYYGVNDESITSAGSTSVVFKNDEDRKQQVIIKKYPNNQQETTGGIESRPNSQDLSQPANNAYGTSGTNGDVGTDRQFARTNDIMFALSPQVTTPPDENTLFSLDEMEVMQSANGGVLMRVMSGMGQDTDIIAFLYTGENFVDGVRLAGYWAYYVGTYQYQTILGVQKNIYAFRMYDKNQGLNLTRKRIEAQNEASQISTAQMVAQDFVSKQLGNNCVQYWSNMAQQRGNSSIFSLFNRPNVAPSVCINESKQFASQPTITKTGENSWEVTSYVEGRDGALPNQIQMVRVSFTVDLTLPPNQQAVLNSIRFYNRENKGFVRSQNGYIGVAP